MSLYKARKAVVILSLSIILIFGLFSCARNNDSNGTVSGTSEDIFARPQIHDCELAFMANTWGVSPRITSVPRNAGTSPWLQQELFDRMFLCGCEIASIRTHVDFPTASYNPEELAEKLRNEEIDVAFVEKVGGQEDFSDEFEYTLIGRYAALVLTSSMNPVNSITTNQLKSIFQGETTNWSELGGDGGEITHVDFTGLYDLPNYLQLNGRQREGKHILEMMFDFTPNVSTINFGYIHYEVFGFEVTEFSRASFASEWYVDSNFSIEIVDAYTFLQSHTFNRAGWFDLKPLFIDGIVPTLSSIYNDEYPFTVNVYAVTRKGELQDDSDLQTFLDWIIAQGLMNSNLPSPTFNFGAAFESNNPKDASQYRFNESDTFWTREEFDKLVQAHTVAYEKIITMLE